MSLHGTFLLVMNKWLYLTGLLATLMVLFSIAKAHPIVATTITNYNFNGQVIICHATRSTSNPYVEENPNITNNGDLDGGHLKDTGAVYPATNWGDIIPPYSYTYCADNSYKLVGSTCKKNSNPDETPITYSYPGLNWTTGGQAIYNDECLYEAPTPTATPTATLTPTATPSVTATPTPTVAPTATPTSVPSSSTSTSSNTGSSSGSSSSSSSSTTTTQAVLGASTMAETGTFTENLMNILLIAGIISLAAGSLSYAKEKNN